MLGARLVVRGQVKVGDSFLAPLNSEVIVHSRRAEFLFSMFGVLLGMAISGGCIIVGGFISH